MEIMIANKHTVDRHPALRYILLHMASEKPFDILEACPLNAWKALYTWTDVTSSLTVKPQ